MLLSNFHNTFPHPHIFSLLHSQFEYLTALLSM
jgi:hypothetical protein